MIEVQCQAGTVLVPNGARGWELYSMTDDEEAAAEITRVVVDAVSNSSLYRAAVRVNAVLARYAKFGATDTEPRYHANHVLSAAFGVEDALYAGRPRKPLLIPGLNILREELRQKTVELSERENHWTALDAEGRVVLAPLRGYVQGLQRAIKILEEA